VPLFVYDFIKVSLLCFVCLSKLDHAICPDSLIEAQSYERIIFSQLTTDTVAQIHRQHYLQSDSKIWQGVFTQWRF